MPNDVLNRLRRICQQEKANSGIVFADRTNEIINDDMYDDGDDDESWIPELHDDELDDDDGISGVIDYDNDIA
jgi:hypothetical protein